MSTQKCGACKWWNPRSADKRTGSCEFPVVTPASSPYPVDRAPMHETDGSTCQCFKPKETGDAARQQG